jgi:hypothetical protein
MRRSWKSRTIAGALLVVGIGALVAVPNSVSASAADEVPTLPSVPHTPLYDVGVSRSVTPADVAAASASPAAAAVLPHYSASIKNGTQTFAYSIVGSNPAVASATPVTTVKTLVIPLVIKFSNGSSWDPSVADSCDPGVSALSRTQKSPIFVGHAWNWGGTSIGTGQLISTFQRAQFWKYAKPTGINPTYGVQLAKTSLAKVIINVPVADAAQTSGVPCGNGLLGAVNINWLDSYLQNTVVPSLATKGLNASTFPLFVVHNVVEYVGSTSNCCVLGYHTSFAPQAGVVQTYGLATYDNSSEFTGVSDISTLTHEVGEWMNDPFVLNPTKPWGHIGQVSGCQSNFEVGDPLSGSTFTDTVGGFTYHPQELAFFSWFYHQSPSIGVNGWYSNKGTFRTAAAACV